MAKLDEIKQKNAQNLEKIRGELNIEAAHLSAEQRAAMKKLRAEIKQAQLKNQNSKDLRAAKQLEIDISRIEAEWKKEEKRLRGQAARAGIKGYFDTTNADVENQKRKNERNLLKQQGRNDVTAEQVGIAHNVGRRIRAFFTGMARIENFEVESAQNAIELARAQAKKAKTDYDKQLWQAATAKIQLMMKETSASPEQQAKLAQKIIDKAVKELGK